MLLFTHTPVLAFNTFPVDEPQKQFDDDNWLSIHLLIGTLLTHAWLFETVIGVLPHKHAFDYVTIKLLIQILGVNVPYDNNTEFIGIIPYPWISFKVIADTYSSLINLKLTPILLLVFCYSNYISLFILSIITDNPVMLLVSPNFVKFPIIFSWLI